MPILRLNAGPEGLALHASAGSARSALHSAARGTGPIIILIHGFKYDPCCSGRSPHRTIFASSLAVAGSGQPRWLRPLGFGTGAAGEGLAIAFAWRARGNLWCAQRAARAAGRHLADIIRDLRDVAPQRPVHVITHSMGSEVVFEALHDLPSGALGRIITLTGASYASRAAAAMRTPAGQSAELLNITSRENDLFDFLFESLIGPPCRGDKAMGNGVDLPNAVNIQLDCPHTLAQLTGLGGYVGTAERRVCHWSGYTRPGVMRFYARAVRMPETVPLAALQACLPQTTAARWSRMFARPQQSMALPAAHKTAS